MWYKALVTSVFAVTAARGAEFSLPGGDNYQGGTVYPGAVACTGGTCAQENDQSVSIYSLYDIANDAGAFAALDIPAEVKHQIIDRVYGANVLTHVAGETDPGDRFGSYYSQIAISKVQVKAPANDHTCAMDYGQSTPDFPTDLTGLGSNCATAPVLAGLADTTTPHVAQLCVGQQDDANERCQEVWWRDRSVGVMPYVDITATNAVNDNIIDPAYPVSMRSRLSHFNERSLEYDADAQELVRSADVFSYCTYDADADADADPTAAHAGNYDCAGKHFCPPSTTDTIFDAAGDFTQTFMDRCFPYEFIPNGAAGRFTMTAEPGTPPPGDWNRPSYGYESAFLESYDCDTGDPTSENILLGVDDGGTPRCLYNPADKAADGAKITLVNPSAGEGTTVLQQHVMYYAPVHVFHTEGGVYYRYTIRATMPMFWGLLVGVLYQSLPDTAVPDITFPLAEPHHINLAYDWIDAESRWRPPMPSAVDAQGNNVLDGEPTTYVIGTIMNVRYNGVVFSCVADDVPCYGGPVISYEGITNLEERAFKFATRVTIDRTTVGGLVSAATVVSGVALDLSLNNQACFKYASDPTPADLIFTMSFSGLEEVFVVSVQSIEYFHEPTGNRIVFASDAVACARTGTPGPGCFDIVAGAASRDSDRFAATATVKLPMDQCRDDFNALPVGDCATKLGDWLSATSGAAAERSIFVTYTMAFGDNTAAAKGFLRRQEIRCDSAGIYCNALIRSDAAENLAQCDESTAIGTEVTINQFTDLVSASLAVVGQPRFKALEKRPPCIALDPDSGDETVACPAMLHDQCDGDQGVASVQHIMEKCGAMYSLPNMEATNMIITGPPTGVPACLHCSLGERTQLTDDCANFNGDETGCNNAYTEAAPVEEHKGAVCFYSSATGQCIRPDSCYFPAHANYPTCPDDGGLRRLQTAGDYSSSLTGVQAGSPVPVLGNGLGFMHLGAVAGPKSQPTTKMQASRQLIFPVGARLTAKCGDNPPVFDETLFGGFDGSDNWLLTTLQWTDSLGMPASRYADMKALMERADTLALIEPALKGISGSTLLTARLVAVDSPAAHARAAAETSFTCDANSVKPFSFLDQTRADDFCAWSQTLGNAHSDACTMLPGRGGGLDVQGFLAAASGGISHGTTSGLSCDNGPAMVLGFNDQSPQYNAYPDSLEPPDQVTPCDPESGEDRGARVQIDVADTCDGIGKDDVCTDNAGYHGCALQPMERELSTSAGLMQSFYTMFKHTHTDDSRSSAAVMSALGVNINTAYLSQCGATPTEWILETQFAHLDGLTPVTSPSCGARGLVEVDGTMYTEGCARLDYSQSACERSFEKTATDEYAPCVWDEAAATCSASTDTCTPETVFDVPYCAYGIWQPGFHLGISGGVGNYCWCRADEKAIYLTASSGNQVSRCIHEDSVGGASVTSGSLNYGRPPLACRYEGRGNGALDVDQDRFVEVDTCTGLAETECNLAYVKWDHSICEYSGGICMPFIGLERRCEMSQVHVPAPSPPEEGVRRLTVSSVTQRYHVVADDDTTADDDNATVARRRAQDLERDTPSTLSLNDTSGPNGTYGSIAIAQTRGVALPCSDATVGAYGVFGSACVCNPHAEGSQQCSLEFVVSTPPPPPPPPPPSDDDNAWFAVLFISMILCVIVLQTRRETNDVATVISLQQSLIQKRKSLIPKRRV